MPELPEVETIVRGLGPRLRGRRVESIWWSGKRLHLRRKVDVAGLRAVAVSRAISGVRRVGKFIMIDVAGTPDTGVLIHLGMTGRLRVEVATAPRPPHTHVVLRLAGGEELRFADARRFGWVEPGRPFAASPALAHLGPDPLSALDAPALAAALTGVRASIKAFLMDQRRIAGLGNIYVSEALYWAGLSPRRLAATVQGERAERLVTAIREVLNRAIAAGGSSLRDYVQASGELGYFQHEWAVYGRESERCPSCDCGSAIKRIVQSGRSTFYCAKRQR